MTRNPCPVCQGRRKVTLRMFRPFDVRVTEDDMLISNPEERSKEYPCPECSPTTSEDKVALLQCGVSMQVHPDEINDPEWQRAMERDTAHRLVDFILKGGYIKFTTMKRSPTFYPEVTIEAVLGLVSPNVVASMQERIHANDTKVIAEAANGVADAASGKISNWASAYTGWEGNIAKGQAIDLVREAARQYVERKKS